MMEALLAYQAEDGMWRQLIDKPESWKETSSTAMFGFAIATGVKRGILVDEKYSTHIKKHCPRSSLTLIRKADCMKCAREPDSEDINYYSQRPRVAGDLHGLPCYGLHKPRWA
jgi:unsaturated rhamnogalacturonyl hydrolase